MVIAHQLCPFAKLPFDQNRIRYRVVEEDDIEKQLMAFWEETSQLEQAPNKEISNSLLLFPFQYPSFSAYLDLYDLAENLLVEQNKKDLFQLASFHPKYQFEDVGLDDVSNYTNRSPFPMIHILRVEEVTAAINSHATIGLVPEINKKKMHELGEEKIKNILYRIKK